MADEQTPAPPTTTEPAATPAEPAKASEGLEPPKPLLGAEQPQPKADSTPIELSKLTIPDGLERNDEALGQFATVAKELNLDQAGAQRMLDLHTAALREQATKPYTLWNETQKKWQDEVRADPEIGGAKLEENLSKVSRVIDRYGGQALREALAYTGAGNNPAIVKAFIQMANALTEGQHVPGGTPAAQTPKGASAMYPNLKP